MVSLGKYALLAVCMLLGWLSHAQPSLSYQVLATENTYVGSHVVSQFDHLLPGDTVSVRSSGYLALISNYFHTLEIGRDSVLVLPHLGVEDVGSAYERPDVRGLFSRQRLDRNTKIGAVEHASFFMDLLFPVVTHTVSTGAAVIPIVWNDNRSENQRREVMTVKIMDMFYDEITQFQMEPDAVCLDLRYYPEVAKVLERDSFVIVSFGQQYLNGREFAIKLAKSTGWKAPFASCEIQSAVSAVALAMFLEYNHGYFKDRHTAYYYELATQLSSHPQYKKINEWYRGRKAQAEK